MTPNPLRLIETPEDVLPRLLRERDQAAAALSAIDAEIKDAGRELASRRGVAFIRVEQLRQEFGAQQ
jgi:hypothetical protein